MFKSEAVVAAPAVRHPVPRGNAERREAFLAASFAERLAIHGKVAACKAQALETRRTLGKRYLADQTRHAPFPGVPAAEGFLRLELGAQTRAARDEARRLAEGREAEVNNRSLEFPVLGRDFSADAEAVRLAASPWLLAPAVRYFGMLPVLFNIFVTRAHTTGFVPDSSHMFHLDPEDVMSLKAFVHITDVDPDSGPLHLLRADATQKLLGNIDYRGIARISDAEVDDLVGWEAVTRCCGAAGTVFLADTTRCLHFGGRPRKVGRPVRYHLVFQYLLPTSFLFPIDGDCEHPRHLPNLTPTGGDHWDALIGARFT